jgi:hypothetical protein
MRAADVVWSAGFELKQHNDLQENLHYIPAREAAKREAAKGAKIAIKEVEDFSLAPPGFPPTTSWTSTPQLALFEPSKETQGRKFVIDSCFSRLFSFYAKLTLPRVSVNEKFRDKCRIAWSNNVAGNLLGKGRVTYGSTTIAEDFPTYADDIERQLNCGKPGQQEARKRDCGIVPQLTEWSQELPQFGPLYVSPGFHFTRDVIHCLRPNLLGSKWGVEITFTPRKYSQVLRMQFLEGEGEEARWVSVPCDPRLVRIEDSAQQMSLDVPPADITATGECIITNPEQRESDLSCVERYVNYVKTYKVQEKQHVGFGEIAELDVTHTSVCVAMFLLAFNERSVAHGCHSNYTTNPEDPQEGVDPVASCRIYYGQTLAKEYDAYHMSNIETRKCPSMPYETGYHAIIFCPCDPFSTSPYALRGIVPKQHQTKVVLTLNRFSEEMIGARKDDKFTVILVMSMLEKIEYTKVDDGLEPAFSIVITE